MTNPHDSIPALGLDRVLLSKNSTYGITSFSNSTPLRRRATFQLTWLSQGLVARDAKTPRSTNQPLARAGLVLSSYSL
jgi:hypothetical protein